MAAICTSLVRRTHPYTRVDIPWKIDVMASSGPHSSRTDDSHRQLFHYLSGGGMRTFGTSLETYRVLARQMRFLWIAGGAVVVWLLFYFV